MQGNKLSHEEWLARAVATHGDRYDYSQARYIKAIVPVTIICGKHGPFEQLPLAHSEGSNCRECSYEQRVMRYGRWIMPVKTNIDANTAIFKQDAALVHGDKYDYNLASYQGHEALITIICKKHGAFKQAPNRHLAGRGCVKCGHERIRVKLKHDNPDPTTALSSTQLAARWGTHQTMILRWYKEGRIPPPDVKSTPGATRRRSWSAELIAKIEEELDHD